MPQVMRGDFNIQIPSAKSKVYSFAQRSRINTTTELLAFFRELTNMPFRK
jgi:hypothetical protein